jgi:hypothetical protein
MIFFFYLCYTVYHTRESVRGLFCCSHSKNTLYSFSWFKLEINLSVKVLSRKSGGWAHNTYNASPIGTRLFLRCYLVIHHLSNNLACLRIEHIIRGGLDVHVVFQSYTLRQIAVLYGRVSWFLMKILFWGPVTLQFYFEVKQITNWNPA